MGQKISLFLCVTLSYFIHSKQKISANRTSHKNLNDSETVRRIVQEKSLKLTRTIQDSVFFPLTFRAKQIPKRSNKLLAGTNKHWHCADCLDSNPLNPHLECPVPSYLDSYNVQERTKLHKKELVEDLISSLFDNRLCHLKHLQYANETLTNPSNDTSAAISQKAEPTTDNYGLVPFTPIHSTEKKAFNLSESFCANEMLEICPYTPSLSKLPDNMSVGDADAEQVVGIESIVAEPVSSETISSIAITNSSEVEKDSDFTGKDCFVVEDKVVVNEALIVTMLPVTNREEGENKLIDTMNITALHGVSQIFEVKEMVEDFGDINSSSPFYRYIAPDSLEQTLPPPDSSFFTSLPPLYAFLVGTTTSLILLLLYSFLSPLLSSLPPHLVNALDDRIQRLFSQQKYEQIVKILRITLPLVQYFRGAQHADTLAFCHYLAKALLRAGRELKEVQQLLEGVLTTYEVWGEDRHTACVYEDLSLLHFKQGNYYDALHAAKISLHMYIEDYEIEHKVLEEEREREKAKARESERGEFSTSRLYSYSHSSLYSSLHTNNNNDTTRRSLSFLQGSPDRFYAYHTQSNNSSVLSSPVSPSLPLSPPSSRPISKALDEAFLEEADFFRTLQELESLLEKEPSPLPLPGERERVCLSVDIGRVYGEMAEIYVAIEEFSEAEKSLEKALEIVLEIYGEESREAERVREKRREVQEKRRDKEEMEKEKGKHQSPTTVNSLELLESSFL